MSIKALVKYAAAQVAETLHSNPEAIVVSSAEEIASLIYQNINFEGLEYQYVAKNKILHELLPIAEQLSIAVARGLTDSTYFQDNLVHALEKGIYDLVSFLDAYSFDLIKPLNDTIRFAETLVKVLTVKYHDNSVILEQASVNTSKYQHDYYSASDAVKYSIGFNRKFYDYVAIDDFAGIDKYYNGTKHNITFAADQNYLGFSKSLADSYSSNDYNVLITGKNFNDPVVFSDATKTLLNKRYEEIYNVVDTPKISSTKNLFDSNIDFTNRLYLSTILDKTDIVLPGDYSVLLTNKKLKDTTSFVDALAVTSNKVLVDTATVQESRKLGDFKKVNADSAFTHERYSAILKKIYTDSTGTSDSLSFGYNFSLDEFPVIGDYNVFSTEKVLNDIPFVVDLFSLHYSKPLHDTISTPTDFSVLRVNKNPADYVSTSDKADLIYTAGANAMFNVALFNQSTFG